jgi:catalase
VLDRNPENFFAQIVQAAFDVANMVPGMKLRRRPVGWLAKARRVFPALPTRRRGHLETGGAVRRAVAGC